METLMEQKPKCGERVKQTFDMQLLNGDWKELWNTAETAWVADY
jgi:hypothetical protein